MTNSTAINETCPDNSLVTPLKKRKKSVTWSPKNTVAYTYSKAEYDRTPCIDMREYFCNNCKEGITCDRFHCEICLDYDLCLTCYSNIDDLGHPHTEFFCYMDPTSQLGQFINGDEGDEGEGDSELSKEDLTMLQQLAEAEGDSDDAVDEETSAFIMNALRKVAPSKTENPHPDKKKKRLVKRKKLKTKAPEPTATEPTEEVVLNQNKDQSLAEVDQQRKEEADMGQKGEEETVQKSLDADIAKPKMKPKKKKKLGLVAHGPRHPQPQTQAPPGQQQHASPPGKKKKKQLTHVGPSPPSSAQHDQQAGNQQASSVAPCEAGPKKKRRRKHGPLKASTMQSQ